MLGVINIGQRLGTPRSRITRINPARTDGIDPYFRAKAHGQRMRQGQQATLARRIGLGVRLGLASAGRRQVDDGTTSGTMPCRYWPISC